MNFTIFEKLSKPGTFATILTLCAGCGGAVSGSLLPSGGFVHDKYPLKIGYGSYPVRGEILGPDWRLDNFQYIDGAADRPKQSPNYIEQVRFDSDDDGVAEGTAWWTRYDLRFVHRKTLARIVLWSTPLSGHDKDVEANVLARSFAEGFDGETRTVAGVTKEGRLAVFTFGRTVTTRILEESECSLAQQPAHRIDLELADVDQIKLDPDRRFRRVRLVVARTPLTFPFGKLNTKREYPVVVYAALISRPEHFESHLPAFDQLMSELGLGSGNEGDPPAKPSVFKCSAPEPQPEPEQAQPPAEPPSTPPEQPVEATPETPEEASPPPKDGTEETSASETAE